MIRTLFYLGEISIGRHWYWHLGLFCMHGQVLITACLVFLLILITARFSTQSLIMVPSFLQNFVEYLTEYFRNLAQTQIGERYYLKWVSFLGTLFLFIFVSNWLGALIPWHIIKIPTGNLAAPTNDINTTVALALLTSFAYFYAGIRTKGLLYFKRYISPIFFLFPINILEDFTKPLSLSFRLFGNILADELIISVLVNLIPLFIPVPLMLLGLFTSAVQALVFATLAGAYIGEALEDDH